MGTQEVLKRITAETPPELAAHVTKEEVDTTEEELARSVLNSRTISEEGKAKVREQLEAGAFRRSETVVDEKVVKELDEYNETRVRQAIKSGKLPPPEADKFFADRMRRAKPPTENKRPAVDVERIAWERNRKRGTGRLDRFTR